MPTWIRRAVMSLVASVLVAAAAVPAFAQAPIEGSWVVERSDGNVWVLGLFGEILTTGNAAAFSFGGQDGGISVFVDLGEKSASSFVPDPPPEATYRVEWFATGDPGDWSLLLFPAEGGGLRGVGVEVSRDYYESLGAFAGFEAGTGWDDPGVMVQFDEPAPIDADQFEEFVRNLRIDPHRLVLSGAEGEGDLVADIPETATTSSTTVATTTTTAASAETTATTAGTAAERPTSGDDARGLPVGVWITLGAVLLGLAIFGIVRFAGGAESDPLPPDVLEPPDPSEGLDDSESEPSGWGFGPDIDKDSDHNPHYDPKTGWTGGIDYGTGHESSPEGDYLPSPDGGYGAPPDDGHEEDVRPRTDEPTPLEGEPVQPDWRRDFTPSSDLGADVGRLSQPLGPHDEFPSDPARRESWIRARIRWRLEGEIERMRDQGIRPPQFLDLGDDVPLEAKRIAAEEWRELWDLEETRRSIEEGNLPEPEPMQVEPVDPDPEGRQDPDDGEFEETIL